MNDPKCKFLSKVVMWHVGLSFNAIFYIQIIFHSLSFSIFYAHLDKRIFMDFLTLSLKTFFWADLTFEMWDQCLLNKSRNVTIFRVLTSRWYGKAVLPQSICNGIKKEVFELFTMILWNEQKKDFYRNKICFPSLDKLLKLFPLLIVSCTSFTWMEMKENFLLLSSNRFSRKERKFISFINYDSISYAMHFCIPFALIIATMSLTYAHFLYKLI